MGFKWRLGAPAQGKKDPVPEALQGRRMDDTKAMWESQERRLWMPR